jgi:hypothetical protein
MLPCCEKNSSSSLSLIHYKKTNGVIKKEYASIETTHKKGTRRNSKEKKINPLRFA